MKDKFSIANRNGSRSSSQSTSSLLSLSPWDDLDSLIGLSPHSGLRMVLKTRDKNKDCDIRTFVQLLSQAEENDLPRFRVCGEGELC